MFDLGRKARNGMVDDTKSSPDDIIPANDNQGPDGQGDETQRQSDQVVLTIARLIGRRMAREQFAAVGAANDSRPKDAQDAEDGADEDYQITPEFPDMRSISTKRPPLFPSNRSRRRPLFAGGRGGERLS
jgi:hypothetical protein